jgi:hypothetical protein
MSYVTTMLVVKYYTDYWMYPVMINMNNFQRTLFILGIYTYGILLYFVGKFTNNLYWMEELKLYEAKKLDERICSPEDTINFLGNIQSYKKDYNNNNEEHNL